MSFSAYLFCTMFLDGDEVSRNSASGESDVSESENDVIGTAGEAKLAEEYNYDDVTAQKKAPAGRKQYFVRIGKSADGNELETADEYIDRPEKKIPPGALAPPSNKGRVKFVRIGRRQRFVRIGRKPESFDGNGEPQSESNADSTDEQELRSFEQIRKRSGRLRFVRIGRNTGA